MKFDHLIDMYKAYYHKPAMRKILLQGKSWGPSRYAIFDFDEEQIIPAHQLSKSRCLNYSNRYTKLIRENEQRYIFLQEALIRTYPLKNLLDRFEEWFNDTVDKKLNDVTIRQLMPNSNITEIRSIYGDKASFDTRLKEYVEVQDYTFDDHYINSIVTFYVPFFADQKDSFAKKIASLADSLYICGWNLANHDFIDAYPLDGNHVIVLVITFEAKYFDIDFEFGKYLYHVTKSSSLKKIDKNGLVPRSQNAIYTYPDRVYLFNNISPNEMVNYMYEKMDNFENQFVLLRIDSTKLQNDPLYKTGKMKFYIDQKYPTETHQHPVAIFTYNNIPRRLIDDEVVVYSLDENGILTDKQKIDLKLQRVNKIK